MEHLGIHHVRNVASAKCQTFCTRVYSVSVCVSDCVSVCV